MFVFRQGRDIGLAVPHAVHRIFAEAVDRSPDIEADLRQQQAFCPLQVSPAHRHPFHALLERMVIPQSDLHISLQDGIL